ncbi:MAG: hypothetical protein UR25_C0001G0143 [Candidatus Nomurabacteria bacterium GW2011_GWE1_32_28]|uniref:DUF5666 domain-containing protein n=1 Tax=Candidatus Nomurabacteria bacterium GW2011_GWF1_31_48 TaxID=1618767 RepID=A0A0G0BI48_9BACT|nr:MAG: hypothetical protein UR10_C0001G0096 [Candidatus Nomurabacteria bacterium GW2011_GWF2_30_133]KKP28974.1 MAG: hypothetical protein UR18_C0001G0095 [Candidatus Nomurabacteria bacterium GW2011_GWE2_31_40]KKP30712.1 MAG: hypothetical protein UR19_C0001G0096 [Candidatus Nomurabacteria bacterium GW2011_GWF1_31_48]KKP35230.1 MAG: hypothetical protein UR25_C0001G0143 [Candidatus Nomurabacteria bacterium GW2011_GWE1_32_28]HAS80537.1 hypothetical protein [Candidatus Nomurabacteria bacterium]
MQNKRTIIYMVISVVVIIGVFYVGTFYGKSQTSALVSSRFGSNMQDRTGQPGIIGGNNRIVGGGFSVGEIISKDDKSVTVKLVDGGSRIIFFSASTDIIKTTIGSMDDLAIGTEISTTGTTNSDGSVTAKSIQIRL